MTSPSPPVSRVLIAAVIAMGILIVIGTAGLIGVVIHRAMAPMSHGSHGPHAFMPVTPNSDVVRCSSKGEGHILSQKVRPNGTLSLHVCTAQGEHIIIWDPEADKIVARFTVTP